MIDYLGIGAHPDDLEIYLSGLFMNLKHLGYRVGFCDLSEGELGTHGTKKLRAKEVLRASDLVGLDFRTTLQLPDGDIRNTPEGRRLVVDLIRTCKPKAVATFGGALVRHPDHHYTGLVVREACFLAGLEKFPSSTLPPHRPKVFFQFAELVSNERPDFIVDISKVWERKVEAIRSYSSQVFTGKDEGKTFIKSRAFWEMFVAKSKWFGSLIGAEHGEGFLCSEAICLADPLRHFVRH